MMWVVGGEKCIHDISQISDGPRQLGRHRCVWIDNVTSPTRYNTRMWTGFIWLGIGLNVKIF